MHWILLVTINLGGIYFQNYEGTYSSKEACVEQGKAFESGKYFSEWKCRSEK